MNINYTKLGLKAGLEIHQQLESGKLFSRTPSVLRKDKPDYLVMRKLHRVAGETGEVDAAVEYEAGLAKSFVYEGYNDTISLVELDEEPPREIDSDALEICLQIALLLKCEVYPNTQVMRKTVIDGSNTSGFQRTVLIAHSGLLDCSFGKVGINTIALEEDSARLISKDKKGKEIVYRLDRLGIPLVEITTDADLKTPEEIKECALKLGEILRACKVKRGIGTIRQDVNVSIKGHDRVEIKGFQDPKIMIKTIDFEIERQLNNINKGKKDGEVRNALATGETKYLRPMPGGARMYPETDLPLLRIGREMINNIKKKLPKLRSSMKEELKKKGLHEELISLILADNEVFEEFGVLMKVYSDANLVGKMVSLWRQDFARKSGKSFSEIKNILSERVFEEILEHVKEGKVEKNDVLGVLSRIIEGKKVEEALHVEKVGDDEIEEFVIKVVKKNPGLGIGGYMGILIKEFGDALDKRKAMEIVKKILKA